MRTEPCTVCGNTDMNLVDGYYYCSECGTQDSNVRETIIEQVFQSDGSFFQSTKKKILTEKPKVEMSQEWYKWHTFNFVLNTWADEVIALGASASFKTKLLWIWTRYIKKFQKKKEMGLPCKSDDEGQPLEEEPNEDTATNAFDDENIIDSDSDCETPTKLTNRYNREARIDFDLKMISKRLLVSMIYIALNLDRSDIQLSQLLRFIREGRISFSNVSEIVPQEILSKMKRKSVWSIFHSSDYLPSQRKIRDQCITIFRELKLGKPVVPDLRKILDTYIMELCLPEEFKRLVLSLLVLKRSHFADVDVNDVIRIPDYECIVLSYVLVALKMCFGLDSRYEYKLSDAVEKINDSENFPKSYVPDSYPTNRLFCFRDWCSFLQFRKTILSKHCLFVHIEHNFDVCDTVFFEHMPETANGPVCLKDEITMDIVNKIIPDEEINVIPKTEFPASLTPLCTYTNVLIDHFRDPEIKLLLAEDFKCYSLKYACVDFNLIDIDTLQNVMTGVDTTNKIKTKIFYRDSLYEKGTSKCRRKNQMIFLRNYESKNWMKTKPPTVDHVTQDTDNNEDVSDITDDVSQSCVDINENEQDTDKKNDSDSDQKERIREETEGVNIFDDDFFDLKNDKDLVESISNDIHNNYYENNADEADAHASLNAQIEAHMNSTENKQQIDDEANLSDASSVDSVEFNPDTFNRVRAIKELVLYACKKYRIPIPKEYNDNIPKKRKHHDETVPIHRKRSKFKKVGQGDKVELIHNLMSTYTTHLQQDLMNQVSTEVQSAIRNFNANAAVAAVDETEFPTENVSAVMNDTLDVNDAIETSSRFSDRNEIKENAIDDDDLVETDTNLLLRHDDPNFDETKYNTDQLYLKVKNEAAMDVDEAMPALVDLVRRNIEKTVKQKVSTIESDAEDDLPLKQIQEMKRKIVARDPVEDFKPLLKLESPPQIHYWLRHYQRMPGRMALERSDWQLKDETPKIFYFILYECASLANVPAHHLYREMETVEQYLTTRLKLPKVKWNVIK